jgi:uncharacterized membrane protein YhaH (DUF805 family)
MEWMLLPFRRYAEFSGRSRRKEYWMFFLFNILVVMAIVAVGLGLMFAGDEDIGTMVLAIGLSAYCLAAFIPGLAVQVRRFHDQDKSGWFVLLGFIPLGSLVVLIFMLIEGTPGPNQYGPDPKAESRPVPQAEPGRSFCSSCGARVPAAAKFCMGCGKQIG